MSDKAKSKNVFLSICMVTRNHCADLKKCLVSLAFQSVSPQEIIIVDNNSSDETQNVVRSFKSLLQCKVRLVKQKKISRVAARNSAISAATNPYVVFIDDDCLADINWIKNIKLSLIKNASATAIIGFSDTQYQKNQFSFAKQIFDSYRKEIGSINQKVIDYEILDTKNLVLNRKYLLKNQISFVQHKLPENVVAIEDCELGRLLEEKGAKVIYDKNIVIFHKDPNTLFSYLKKYWQSSFAFYYYRKFWPEKNIATKKIKLRHFWQERFAQLGLGSFEKMKIISVICLTVGLDWIQLVATKTLSLITK